jgi:predicted DNA-binding transcriptional regulator YafY
VAGGYRLGAGAALPPLLLDDDEAVAVALSLRTAASHTVTGIGEASLRALGKLEQVLPTRLRERTRTLGLATVPLTGAAPTVDAATLTVIAGACRRRERLSLRYTTRDGEQSTRVIEPHRLVQAGYRWYLVARDTERDDWRTFRVDRISAPQATGVRFALADPPDAAAFVANAVTTAPYRYRARVLLHQRAEIIAERMPPTVGVIEPAGQDRCLLTTGSDSLDAITVHLAMLGADFTVLEPPELTARLRALADRLRAAAELSAGRPG